MKVKTECVGCPLGSPNNEACPILRYCAIFKEGTAKICPMCKLEKSCSDCIVLHATEKVLGKPE